MYQYKCRCCGATSRFGGDVATAHRFAKDDGWGIVADDVAHIATWYCPKCVPHTPTVVTFKEFH